MRITILTLFPGMFQGPFDHSILKRAKDKKLLEIDFIDIRQFGIGKHKVVDDTPYGGGAGMVMRVDVVKKAIEAARCPALQDKKKCKEKVILLDPQGKVFNQMTAEKLTKTDHLILICGRYEGIDERIREFVDEEISIGDYVLTGGEIPAMIIVDAVSRLIPNVLGKDESSQFESFQKLTDSNMTSLEYPQYTQPREFEGLEVPSILLSGNHEKIKEWRMQEACLRTKKRRPDLLHQSH